MESIIALEELIKENEAKAELQQRQLDEHLCGKRQLSPMVLASTESNLEEATILLEKYRAMLEKLSRLTPEELEEKERLHAAAMRKKYFDTQESRIRANIEKDNDIKLEVLRIIGELPMDVQFKDEELFDMATKSISLSLPNLNELVSKLEEIRQDFAQMTKNDDERSMQEFATIDFLIPIVVLHFYILSNNIKENLHEYNEKIEKNQEDLMENASGEEMFELEQTGKIDFTGFPRYQDWWIRELWVSHQAYFALFSWKALTNKLCFTTEQKKAWSIIFDRWVFIKKLLNDKGELAYNYNFAFDTMLYKYVSVQEELVQDRIIAVESLIQKMTKEEDFTQVAPFHDTITPYLKYKLQRIEEQNRTK